jgi:exonuclease SbcC
MELEQKKQACLETENLLKGKNALDSQKADLESEESELEKLEAEKERVEQKGMALKTRKESINLQIQNVGRLVVEHQGKIAELIESKHSSVCPLCSSPIADRAAVITRYERLIEDAQKESADLKLESATIDDELVELRNKYKVFKERLDTRKELDKQIGAFREKQRAIERAEESQLVLTKALKTLELRLASGDYAQVERESLLSIKDQLSRLEFDPIYYNSLQAQVRAQRAVEPRYHQIQKDLAELKSIEANLPAISKEIDELKAALSEESYGKEIREVLNNLDKELERLDYNRGLHSESKQQLAKLLPVAERHRDLKKALEEKPLLSQSAQNLEELLAAKIAQVATLNESLKSWQEELTNLPNVEAEVETLRPLLEEAKTLYDRLLRQSAAADARTNQLETEIEMLKAKREELNQTKQALEDYTFLAEAFGKKGIQAIIIENAIPEIETDANRLLSRLTDNRMHVALVTQQKNKTGNVIETLDILIGDEVGTRNYELYSGGEAFKVNFAIRVALSRLLARRSGAKLETLIIDEGFGSQDDQSRDRLVKAIRSIQDDFAKILVITHFSDVKEMFPTHILVSKVNGTSQIQLLS